jgi:hypothetical protein
VDIAVKIAKASSIAGASRAVKEQLVITHGMNVTAPSKQACPV